MRVDLFKVESLFSQFQGKPVIIHVTGTITIPFYIKKFDWQHLDDEICFGEFEDCDNWFRLEKDEIKEINHTYDNFTHEDYVEFRCHYDIFTTYITVIHDCSMMVACE